MKKIALTSLIAMFTVAGAQAANVIDGNPLYMPKAGHAYSVTSLESHTGSEAIKTWGINEEFGYGITDKLAVLVETDVSETDTFDAYSWNDLSLSLAYRAYENGAWKADVMAGYSLGPVWADHRPFLEKGDNANATGTEYVWTLGVRGGYVASNWTIAGHALFNYWNTESFNWSEKEGLRGLHAVTLGLDGQYVFDSHWSALLGVEYNGMLDKKYRGEPGSKIENAGTWSAELGVNYNIDASKFVGVYVNADMDHQGGDKNDEWKVQNGFGFGAKFGIDF